MTTHPTVALRAAGLAVVVATLMGCATAPAGKPVTGDATPGDVVANPVDPWEAFNRKVYAFNDAVDTAVLKPVAETYEKVVPKLVRTGVSNVLGNIRDVWSAANQLLQGKLQYGMEMSMRVLTNTFFGIGGLLDPATEMGLVRRSEDVGQTLGRWGVGTGPYLVLPLLGPSTVRDTVGFVADRQVGPSSLPPTSNGRYAVTGVEVVDTRARLLSAGNLLDNVALDRYSFLRDAYLSSRLDAVYDGAPPLDDSADPGDGPPPPAAPVKGATSASAASAATTASRPAAAASAAAPTSASASAAAK